MDRDPPGCPPTLNTKQHALWASEPDVARCAVDAVVVALGPIAPDDIMLPITINATLEAAATFDPGRCVPYRQWAFYYASLRLWEHLLRMQGRDKDLVRRIRTAMFRFNAHHIEIFDLWKVTRETDQRALAGYTDGMLFTGAMELGVEGPITRGDEDVLYAEDARRTGDAVRRVVDELSPEHLYLLRQCAAYGEPVKEAAKHLKKGYRTVLEDFHEIKARCGARLRALLRTDETPPWHSDLSGQVFEDPPEAANDGGRGG